MEIEKILNLENGIRMILDDDEDEKKIYME